MRVLVLAPWPIRRPLHGGQIRGSEIVRAYGEAGHETEFIGLYDRAGREDDEYSEQDHPITPALASVDPGGRTPEMGFWHALANEPASFARYRDQMLRFTPDLIQFEEPFLWPVANRLAEAAARERGGRRLPVLHSSYNIEHVWRRQYRDATEIGNGAFIGEIAALEQEIARHADGVCVVSGQDAEAFRAMGARAVTLAPNGTALPAPTPAAIRTVRQYLDRQPFALFVSSAHPPNASGLMGMIEGAPDARLRNGVLVALGDVDRLLRPHADAAHLQHLFRHIRLLGRVTTDLLAAFYAEARVAVVPRALGGGSNLKTAEALLAGRPIIATSRAFVGFEDFATAAGVRIVDEPDAFWREVEALLGDGWQSAPIRRDGLDALTWSRTLAPMVRLAEALCAAPASALSTMTGPRADLRCR